LRQTIVSALQIANSRIPRRESLQSPAFPGHHVTVETPLSLPISGVIVMPIFKGQPVGVRN